MVTAFMKPIDNQDKFSSVISHIQNISRCLPEPMRLNPDMETVRKISELPSFMYTTESPSFQLLREYSTNNFSAAGTTTQSLGWETHMVNTYQFESDSDLIDLIRKEFRENWRCFVLYTVDGKRVRGKFVSPDREVRNELTRHMRDLIIGEMID